MTAGLCGSAPYIAPEEYSGGEFDPRAVDVWACGVIYMAMRTGRHLWRVARKDEDEFYERYLDGRRDEDGYAPIESLHRVSRFSPGRGHRCSLNSCRHAVEMSFTLSLIPILADALLPPRFSNRNGVARSRSAKLELKASVVEGTYYDQAGTQVIATIPSREVLLGKLLGSIQSPITNLARVLNQIAEKNGGAAEA